MLLRALCFRGKASLFDNSGKATKIQWLIIIFLVQTAVLRVYNPFSERPGHDLGLSCRLPVECRDDDDDDDDDDDNDDDHDDHDSYYFYYTCNILLLVLS